MSESLSQEELAELIRHGRLSTSRSSAKRRQAKASSSIDNKPKTPHVNITPARESPAKVEPSKLSEKEPDPEWLKAEKEKAERNIAAERQDKRRRDEMQEASRF